MKKRILFLLIAAVGLIFVPNYISAATYYVSPTGTTTGSGTLSNPLTFTSAIAKSMTAGDSIIVRGGFYSFSSMQTVSRSGSSANFIHIVSYPGEIPILDFRTQPYSSSNIGVKVSGNYIHVKGLTIQGAGDNGMQVTGSNNWIENCTFRWNCDSGLQLKTGSNNLVENCDSYENFDYKSGTLSSPDFGGNADGFADKQYSNTGTNIFRGCRAWRNSDDAWDSYEKIGNTVYENCWSFSTGPNTYDMTENIRFKTDSATWFYQFKNASGRYVMTNYGNGNGFKLGGNYTANNCVLTNCIAVGNKVKGFDQNNNNGTMTLYNCTGYNNKNNYGFSNSSYGTLIIKNSASLNSSSSNSFNSKSVTQAYNSWNSGFSCTAADFLSLDQQQLLNERQSDGSLPYITFLRLAPTSGMIDKGTNVGLPFFGSAPDLGAYEYNPSTSTSATPNTDIAINYMAGNNEISVRGQINKVEIYELTGQRIAEQYFHGESGSIPTSNWKKGIYLVRVISKGGSTTTKKVLID